MFDTVITVPSEWEFLDTLEPGVILGAALAGVDIERVSGTDRVLILKALDRMASHFEARRSQAMASLVEATEFDEFGEEDTIGAAAAEARLALRLTRRAADVQLGDALDLQERLPQVWGEWLAGRLDGRRVGVILHATSHLDPEEARAVVEAVMDAAPDLTTGQLRARLRRLCMEARPDEATRRYDEAVEARRVWVEATDSGTASLHVFDLPPHRVAAAQARIQRQALSLRRSGDSRTIDQLRADVLLDLLDGGGTDAVGANVDLRVDLDTLALLANTPGDLGGYGPVIADIARQVAASTSGSWSFGVTDPETGQLVEVGTTRRRPTAGQQRSVRALHPSCVFPGCRMPASDCDLDHRTAYAEGGPTSVDNLTPLCRHDHRLRHLPGWSYEAEPDGTLTWTTALGLTYENPANGP